MTAVYTNMVKRSFLVPIIPFAQIVGRSIALDGPLVEAIANETRRSFCAKEPIGTVVLDTGIQLGGPLKAAQEALFDRICGLPEDPVPRAPRPIAPSNAGGCECQPYRVDYELFVDKQSLGSSFTVKLGPIATYSRVFTGGGGEQLKAVGITHRGNAGAPCSPTTQRAELIQAAVISKPRLEIKSIAPVSGEGFIECSRPTYPAPLPTDGNDTSPPTITIPIPGLPPLIIPVINVPVVVPVGVSFAPKLVFDVGGVNFEFNMEGVDITVNTTNNAAPITIVQPGFKQPSLPPSVSPINIGEGGEDCCEEILARMDAIDSQLDDIEDCVCPKELEVIASFDEVQTYTIQSSGRKIRRVEITVSKPFKTKTFNVPGGQEVSFVGWFAFMEVQRKSSRKPLQFTRSVCLSDNPESDGFTASVYNGLTMSGFVLADVEE